LSKPLSLSFSASIMINRSALIFLNCLLFLIFLTGPTHSAFAAETRVRGAVESQKLYRCKIEHGHRRTASGALRGYTLYIPQLDASLPPPPFPIVLLAHGFLMTGFEQSINAKYLAEHGFIVITPNLSRLLWGDEKRTKNIADLVDHLAWLIELSKTPHSSLSGVADPSRIAIGGNSSGGAVCLELLFEAQKANIPVRAVCMLEGVPWERSLDQVAQLKPTQLLSLRAETCICNENARMLYFLNRLKFPHDDIRINGAHHCDAENPPGFGCKFVCGRSREAYRNLFKTLMCLYLQDTLDAPTLTTPRVSFASVVQDLQHTGKISANLHSSTSEEISSENNVVQEK
jgi:Chlorophyllase enzyme